MANEYIERLKEVGKTFNLVSIDFLDENGGYSNDTNLPCIKVKIQFSNGETFSTTAQEFFQELGDYKFKIGGDITH